MTGDVLIVDDEADIRELVAGILADEGYAVRTAGDSDQALTAIRARRLLLVVERAIEASSLKRENRRLRTLSAAPDGFPGASAAAQSLRQMIAKVAPANSRVLITGPAGA